MWIDLDAGSLLVAMFGIAVGAALMGQRAAPVRAGGKILVVVIGAVTAAFGAWQIISLHLSNADIAEFGADLERRGIATHDPIDPTVTTIAFGLYLMIAAGLGLIVIALAGRVRRTSAS
jgi:hypothetical protein